MTRKYGKHYAWHAEPVDRCLDLIRSHQLRRNSINELLVHVAQNCRKINYFFIIKVFWAIVFIFIIISTTFRPISSSAFFKCLSDSGTFTELRTSSFIESTVGVAYSDSLCHNHVHVLSIPVLLLTWSQDWTCNLQMIVSLEA